MKRLIRSFAHADHKRKRSPSDWPLPGGAQRKKGLISRPESFCDVAQPGRFERPRPIHKRASRSNGAADRGLEKGSGVFSQKRFLERLPTCSVENQPLVGLRRIG